MNLGNKKELVAKTFSVGKDRIIFNVNRISDINEAITKQDIRDLRADGAIIIKSIKGRKKVIKRTTRRRAGSVRKKVKNGKRKYIIITRKLRTYLRDLRRKNSVSEEEYTKLRRGIRAHRYKSKSHFKEHLNTEAKK